MQQMRTPSPLQSWPNGEWRWRRTFFSSNRPTSMSCAGSCQRFLRASSWCSWRTCSNKCEQLRRPNRHVCFDFSSTVLTRRDDLPRQVRSALAPPSTCLRGPRRQHRCPPLRNQRSLPQTKRLRQSVPRLLSLSWANMPSPRHPPPPPPRRPLPRSRSRSPVQAVAVTRTLTSALHLRDSSKPPSGWWS